MAVGLRHALGGERARSTRRLAMVMANRPQSIALFFALSSFSVPLVLLPPDMKPWRSDPPLPRDTLLVLLESERDLEADARSLDVPVAIIAEPEPPAWLAGCSGLHDDARPRPLHVGIDGPAATRVPQHARACSTYRGARARARTAPWRWRDHHLAPRARVRTQPWPDGRRRARVSARPVRSLRAQRPPASVRIRRVSVLGGHADDGRRAGPHAPVGERIRRLRSAWSAAVSRPRSPAASSSASACRCGNATERPRPAASRWMGPRASACAPTRRAGRSPVWMCGSATTRGFQCTAGHAGRIWLSTPAYMMDGYGFPPDLDPARDRGRLVGNAGRRSAGRPRLRSSSPGDSMIASGRTRGTWWTRRRLPPRWTATRA